MCIRDRASAACGRRVRPRVGAPLELSSAAVSRGAPSASSSAGWWALAADASSARAGLFLAVRVRGAVVPPCFSLMAAIRSPLRRPPVSIPSSPASWRSSARTMPESPPRRRGVPLASDSCWPAEEAFLASLLNSSVLLTNVLPDRTAPPTRPSGLPARSGVRAAGVCYQPFCRSDQLRARGATDFGDGSGNQQHRAVGGTRLACPVCDASTPIHTCRCTPCCRLIPGIPDSTCAPAVNRGAPGPRAGAMVTLRATPWNLRPPPRHRQRMCTADRPEANSIELTTPASVTAIAEPP